MIEDIETINVNKKDIAPINVNEKNKSKDVLGILSKHINFDLPTLKHFKTKLSIAKNFKDAEKILNSGDLLITRIMVEKLKKELK